VAAGAPYQEPGTISLRPVLIVAGILAVATVAFLIYSCSRAPARGSFSAPVAQFPLGSVTYLASGRSYLVRSDDGGFVALSEVVADPASRLNGCLIRYRADLSAGSVQGVFRDSCSGTMFDRSGKAIQGSSPSMQRHPVQVTGGNVTVKLRSCLNGESGVPEACRE